MNTPHMRVMRRIGFAMILAAAALRPAAAVSNGVQVLSGLTVPAGGAWIPGALGGHYWQPDGVLGICRVNGGATGNCSGTAKSGGQIAVTTDPATGTVYVFVPDSSAKSNTVVRYVFDPATETLNKAFTMNVPNVNTIGGGVAGGRPSAAVVDAAGNLYVGYVKSGDIMKVPNAMTTTQGTPPVALVAHTSDGRGVNAMMFFGVDLYLAESGGAGVSVIPDISGTARAACSAAAPCGAAPLNPQISFFPGALATDGVYIYVGDAPLTTPGSVLQFDPTKAVGTDPATGIQNPASYSVNVPPYTSTFDGATRSQYVGIRGMAFGPGGDLYISDDPTASLVLPVLPTAQGHLWKVAFPGAPLRVISMTPASVDIATITSKSIVTLIGTGFPSPLGGLTACPAPVGGVCPMSVTFGTAAGGNVTCTSVTTCTVRIPLPNPPGPGTVPVTVSVGTQTVMAGDFTYTQAPTVSTPTVYSVSPNFGLPAGGTKVRVLGMNLSAGSAVLFGLAGRGTIVFPGCGPITVVGIPTTVVNSQCWVTSPTTFNQTGTVDVQIIAGTGGNVQTSSTNPGDRFSFQNPTATLFAWGITAPKGGLLFVPGALGGHFWSSDHGQGLCRQDPMTARPAGFGTPATPGSATLFALNTAVCDNGSIGSPGQAVYDPRVNPQIINTSSGRTIAAGTHYIYVPDNAVRSTAVWRLTFDPATETLVDLPEAMVPLADVRTLKPNGMALGPDGNLYVTDLTEMNIRRLNGPNGDPRLQTLDIVAVTGDGRGANGTIGFIGNTLYISENRAAAFFDVTQCPILDPLSGTKTPCTTADIPLPSGAFISGVATDPVHNYVYASDSPGGANATIWRYDLNNPGSPAIAYLTGGKLPAAGTPEATVWVTQTGVRPWFPAYTPGGTAGFAFAFGIYVDQRNGDLYITGDPLAGARGGIGSAWVAKLTQ